MVGEGHSSEPQASHLTWYFISECLLNDECAPDEYGHLLHCLRERGSQHCCGHHHTRVCDCDHSTISIFLWIKVCALSRVWLFATPWTAACQVPPVHGIFQGVGCHALFQGIFLTQGSNPRLLCLLHQQADSLPLPCLGSLLWIQEHIILPPFLKWASEPRSSSWGQYGNQDLDPIQADSETHACSHNVSVPPWLYRRMEMKKRAFSKLIVKKKKILKIYFAEKRILVHCSYFAFSYSPFMC